MLTRRTEIDARRDARGASPTVHYHYVGFGSEPVAAAVEGVANRPAVDPPRDRSRPSGLDEERPAAGW